MKWAKVGKVALFILGLLPYVGMTFLVVWLWDKYLGGDYGFLKYFYIVWGKRIIITMQVVRFVLQGLSVIGSWVVWWVFCKIVKYSLISLRTTV